MDDRSSRGRDRIRVVKRSLRSSGDDFGPLDLLDLKSEDPAPAPAPERCTALAEWYTQEAKRLRGMGERARTRLLGLQRERLIFFILWKVGVRRSSLASFRFDQLKRDDEGMWYFDWCVTKRTRAPKRVVIQTWRVGDTTFSRWYAPQEFIDLLEEALRDEGYDLQTYLQTRDEQYVPWATAHDATFGPHFQGKRIAPVWRGKRGALSVGRGRACRCAHHASAPGNDARWGARDAPPLDHGQQRARTTVPSSCAGAAAPNSGDALDL
jgi:hypothetical protein